MNVDIFNNPCIWWHFEYKCGNYIMCPPLRRAVGAADAAGGGRQQAGERGARGRGAAAAALALRRAQRGRAGAQAPHAHTGARPHSTYIYTN